MRTLKLFAEKSEIIEDDVNSPSLKKPRTDQTIITRPSSTPLTAEITHRLNALKRLHSQNTEILRQASMTEKFDRECQDQRLVRMICKWREAFGTVMAELQDELVSSAKSANDGFDPRDYWGDDDAGAAKKKHPDDNTYEDSGALIDETALITPELEALSKQIGIGLSGIYFDPVTMQFVDDELDELVMDFIEKSDNELIEETEGSESAIEIESSKSQNQSDTEQAHE